MSKKVIECEYCHTLISEDDVKCPECGANCSNVIKKYRKEQEEKEKEEKEESLKVINSAFESFKSSSKIITIVFSIIFITIFIFVITHFINVKKEMNSFDFGPSNDIEVNEDNKNVIEKVTIGYKETGETDGLKITLDSYELFEYHADNFESYNTPKGYQKIAFHFIIENVSNEDKYLYKFIDLIADYSPVDDCKIEITRGFDKVVKGKEKYESLNGQTIRSGQTLKGYLGFVVPKDKKELNFIIKNLTIKMDNPTYKK